MELQDLHKFSKGDVLNLNGYQFIVVDTSVINDVTYYQLSESPDPTDKESQLSMMISEIKLLNLGTFQNYYQVKLQDIEELRDKLIKLGVLV